MKYTSRKRENPKQRKLSEVQEIQLIGAWIESGKPDNGSNPLSLPPLREDAQVGRLQDGMFSRYVGAEMFSQLPMSQKTKDGLSDSKYVTMTDIQRASLPHALCGRDILGAAKTGSGKSLAFIIPILEKLYQERWGPEDGVGSIIISPTRELALQLFGVLQSVGKYHAFSAGLLIGGRKDVDSEKECVNELNILVCTPGRLLQHMDGTPNFDCSQLQILILDEADRILDVGFKKTLNAIISQLPKRRQTLLFSATQTKSVQDLARLSLKDPEYLGVHEESATATPNQLQQVAIIVPLEQKLNMLWNFVKSHLSSKILVFLSTVKQVKFVFEAFKKLHPGIPLKCLHGRMKQGKRIVTYSQYCEKHSVLFSTDVASRGLDFDKAVDWVVQVDCPDDVDTYIHRVGRTARYVHDGKSLLFLIPSEEKMLQKLQEKRIPIHVKKAKEPLSVTSGLELLLVKYPAMHHLAQRAFITYLRSICKQRDKEVFDVQKLPIAEFSASLGLPMTPKLRFLNTKKSAEAPSHIEDEDDEEDFLTIKKYPIANDAPPPMDVIHTTRVTKKKKLKINVCRPLGTRVVFDDEGNELPPLALMPEMGHTNEGMNDRMRVSVSGAVEERCAKMKDAIKAGDKEDKAAERKRLREKRAMTKIKLKKRIDADVEGRSGKRVKVYVDGDDEKQQKSEFNDSIALAEQEELALKLLESMH